MAHPELQAVFDEHSTPKHCGKRDVHDQMSPIADIASKAIQQVATFRALLLAAELAPHDEAVDFKLESIHQTLAAAEREVAQFTASARGVAQVFTQLDRYMKEWPVEIQRMESLKAQSAPSVP